MGYGYVVAPRKGKNRTVMAGVAFFPKFVLLLSIKSLREQDDIFGKNAPNRETIRMSECCVGYYGTVFVEGPTRFLSNQKV